LNADPDITFDSLDGNAIVNSLQKAGFNLFFAPDEWPGETYFARHREMLVAIESGATPTSWHIDEDDDSDSANSQASPVGQSSGAAFENLRTARGWLRIYYVQSTNNNDVSVQSTNNNDVSSELV
jgi:hypothetical protein